MDEFKDTILQNQKDAILPSLLYVTRKLGEVEGIISTQADADDNLVNVQEDFQRLFDTMVEKAGVEILPEIGDNAIGGDGG
jgi:copper chaperone CopZ